MYFYVASFQICGDFDVTYRTRLVVDLLIQQYGGPTLPYLKINTEINKCLINK